MKTSKVLLMLAAILSFDVSLFTAMISLRPKWSAAFGAPAVLLADRELLLAAGLFTALVVVICGLYALSGAGVITRLPFLRFGLLSIGCGYVILGTAVVTRFFGWSDVVPLGAPIPWRLTVASCVVALTGLAYLAGLGVGWGRLTEGEQETRAALSGRAAATTAASRAAPGVPS